MSDSSGQGRQEMLLALVSDRPPAEEGTLHNYLKKNEKQNKSYVYDTEVKGSKEAELSYRVLGRSEKYYLIEVDLHTGRHHQIRAQLAAAGCPIKGDLKYGSKGQTRVEAYPCMPEVFFTSILLKRGGGRWCSPAR